MPSRGVAGFWCKIACGTYVWRHQDLRDGAQEAPTTIAEELWGPSESPMSHGAGRRRPEPSKRHTWSIHGHHSIYGSCIVAKYWLLGLGRDRGAKKYRDGTCYCFLLRLISKRNDGHSAQFNDCKNSLGLFYGGQFSARSNLSRNGPEIKFDDLYGMMAIFLRAASALDFYFITCPGLCLNLIF
jgi:hypothetical protein